MLVIFQFVTAIVLSIASLVFYQQMHFIHSKNLGYNPTEIIKIDINGARDVHQILENFGSEMKNNLHIKQLSLTGDFGIREAPSDLCWERRLPKS
ncbi:hypothetical protein [Dyadobacter sp. CY323]|uniref:hypothetical protein n=1 Tax=Dyadobacter sp. CY323 TaxID=2907302 RepID=UPI001F45ED39|nr:hypothetical protein [Dyadobacter sp. CY323]MCE6992382.1 hypothetical protein [Dyadobacter sp. CY323]